jgi:SAM-dependent methyltransferase
MANPEIQRRMRQVVRRSGIRPERVLEVGGYVDEKSLLRFKRLRRAERWCINLVDQPDGTGINHVVGSSNDMHMFKDGSFDLVMSCAVHEHDKKFWLSIQEMHRVLRPGGLLVICVPGFDKRPTDRGQSTTTFHVHYHFDYYRFTRRAMREVFLEGFEGVKAVSVLDPPRVIGHGYKPVNRRQQAARSARRRLSAVRRRAAVKRRLSNLR